MTNQEIRLRILEQMIPKAAQVGITKPEMIIESCSQFEKYVLGSDEGEDSLTSKPRRRRGPRKGKADNDFDEDQTPAHVGQVE